jgi:hypothetical protein
MAKFEDDLLRQNSLIHDRWRVYRWTDRQVAEEGERVKEQLALLLGSIPGLLAFDDFLPKQRGEVVRLELRRHQREANTLSVSAMCWSAPAGMWRRSST